MVDLLNAFIDSQWSVAAVLFWWVFLERQERLKDKTHIREERQRLSDRLDGMVSALTALKERLK